jgi:heme/copper-type cytochrome/quinol oxidase subunit 1
MMSEGLGKLSFVLFLVGFHLTFLIQHSAGLDGMPRRIYEYADSAGWDLMNLISSIGAFVLGTSVLLTIINLVRSLKRGPIAGPGALTSRSFPIVPDRAATTARGCGLGRALRATISRFSCAPLCADPNRSHRA